MYQKIGLGYWVWWKQNQHLSQNSLNYKPIACWLVIYKIISKMLCERMKEVLPHIIDLNQGVFSHKRSILHNVLLSPELLRVYHQSHENRPWNGLLFDLMEFLDSITWRFYFSSKICPLGERMHFYSQLHHEDYWKTAWQNKREKGFKAKGFYISFTFCCDDGILNQKSKACRCWSLFPITSRL